MFDERNENFNENSEETALNSTSCSDIQSDEPCASSPQEVEGSSSFGENDTDALESTSDSVTVQADNGNSTEALSNDHTASFEASYCNTVSGTENVTYSPEDAGNFGQNRQYGALDDVTLPTADENISDSTDSSYNGDAPSYDGAPAYGGVPYHSTSYGHNTSGYSWNSSATQRNGVSKHGNSGSSKGFRIFIASILTVFTVSVVMLTVMVGQQISQNGMLFADTAQASGEQGSSESSSSYSSTHSSANNIKVSSTPQVVYDAAKEAEAALPIPVIAAKCLPSSVGIVSKVEVSYSYPFGFGTTSGISEASGSGFIYSSDGYVITNHHVIEDAVEVSVILQDGTEYEAQVIGSDSLSDIAVLKIQPDENNPLVPMEIGNSDEIVVGESVVAIGCPAGMDYIGTVTDGIISAINRNIEISDDYGTAQKTMTLIQTNATINQGNSGGPLINSKGQVIGINTLKLNSYSYEGIGFSIPINGAMPIIKQLIEHGKVIERTQSDFAYGKGVIGITGSAVTEDEAEYYNIPMGVLVIQIDKNSSAAKAGLRRGDIITHYNGKKVEDVNQINEAKGNARAGEEVTVTVYRDNINGYGEGETVDITFKLDAQK